MSLRSEPRTTRDIDVVVAVAHESEAVRLVQFLAGARGYAVGEALEHEPTGQLATQRLVCSGDQDGVVVDLLFASILGARGAIAAAIRGLDQGARKRLLRLIGPRQAGLVANLVDRRPEIYRELLEIDELQDIWLWPLHGELNESWKDLARIAVAKGLPRRAIARNPEHGVVTTGSGLTQYQSWRDFFSSLLDDEDLAEVGRAGAQHVDGLIELAKERERRWAVEGIR
ncbi:MAG TPA: hypothetical protein VMV46_06905 [Thermoanaerobaculia bacterium]|nr:hypothetical protein [Thermoanaerobaculia bacterium]